MISLDQVYLLEQKVESAVAKIQQLQAENDALRNKCAELTNALSAKSEQLTSFESDQSQIETGIKKALDRLNSIENTVLKTAAQMNQGGQAAAAPVQSTPIPQAEEPKPATQAAPVQSAPSINTEPSFNTMQAVPQAQPDTQKKVVQDIDNSSDFDDSDLNDSELDEPEIGDPELDDSEIDDSDEDNHDGLGFDIF